MADSKIDPFDVAALEKSLNDSATRVSAIWLSFLIFSLYLLTAATTVTHRQLFLAEPVKLPVLNIDLPLWGFFFLAPILFVIFHAYVLIQVILLARTAAAYNEAIDRSIHVAADNARVRQRLANTLFAQIFAGSPREREGWLGSLLRTMARITLAIAPIVILLTFQFMFLPYHSHIATWTHRILILIELIAFFALWPLALDAQREVLWRRMLWRPAAATAFVLWILISLSLATFPGEPHVNVANGHSWSSVACDRWVAVAFDRLHLERVDVVDDEKLAKIITSATARGQRPYESERTRSFRERNLDCGDFSSADLRRVDMTRARLSGANFSLAELTGATFGGAVLRGAFLTKAQAQSVLLVGAELQGAKLNFARLQGANLYNARLRGADLTAVSLQGATLEGATLQAADFDRGWVEGVIFDGVLAQHATFTDVAMSGTSFARAQLQNVTFASDLTGVSIDQSYLAGAGGRDCTKARVVSPKLDEVLEYRAYFDSTSGRDKDDSVSVMNEAAVRKWIEEIVADVPEDSQTSVRARLTSKPRGEMSWDLCRDQSERIPERQFQRALALQLRDIACNTVTDRDHVVSGIVSNWLDNPINLGTSRTLLAEGLLNCAAAKELDEVTKERVRELASRPAAQ